MTKDMLRIRRRLEMEVEDILCPQLFSYYHENRGGHTEADHIGMSLYDLRQRARQAAKERSEGNRRRLLHEKDGSPAEASVFSRFFGNREEVVKLIHQCLVDNFELLYKAITISIGEVELELLCDSPIGDGILEEGDWQVLHPCSKMHVVVGMSNNDRLFIIKTAYPTFNLDETDEAFEHLYFYREKNRKRWEQRKTAR